MNFWSKYFIQLYNASGYLRASNFKEHFTRTAAEISARLATRFYRMIFQIIQATSPFPGPLKNDGFLLSATSLFIEYKGHLFNLSIKYVLTCSKLLMLQNNENWENKTVSVNIYLNENSRLLECHLTEPYFVLWNNIITYFYEHLLNFRIRIEDKM